MEQVADILGPGSEYTEDRLWSNVMIPVDYEGAVENYRALTEQDGLTGGYTRLFCDYMGIIEQSFITSDLKKTLKHTHSKRFPKRLGRVNKFAFPRLSRSSLIRSVLST